MHCGIIFLEAAALNNSVTCDTRVSKNQAFSSSIGLKMVRSVKCFFSLSICLSFSCLLISAIWLNEIILYLIPHMTMNWDLWPSL